MPPKTVVPIDRQLISAAPVATSNGNSPIINAIAVIIAEPQLSAEYRGLFDFALLLGEFDSQYSIFAASSIRTTRPILP